MLYITKTLISTLSITKHSNSRELANGVRHKGNILQAGKERGELTEYMPDLTIVLRVNISSTALGWRCWLR